MKNKKDVAVGAATLMGVVIGAWIAGAVFALGAAGMVVWAAYRVFIGA